MNQPILNVQRWPKLDWEQWKETADTLHMFMQIVGKTRVALTPTQNHWWNVPLYVTARGLTTSALPVPTGGLLDIEFDFIAHELVCRSSSGQIKRLTLRPQSVAAFFAEYLAALADLGVKVDIDPMPVELKQPIRFHQDTTHKSYEADAVLRFWQVLSKVDTLLKRFSTNFYGKISPVHFFWGSMDLAVNVSTGAEHRHVREQTLSRPRPILTNASALAFGRETAVTAKPRSIPTRLQFRTALARQSSAARAALIRI